LILHNEQVGRLGHSSPKLKIITTEIDTKNLSPSQVVVRNELSSINFKDKLLWLSTGTFGRHEFQAVGFDGVGSVVFSGGSSSHTVGSKVIFFGSDEHRSEQAGLQTYSVHDSDLLYPLGSMSPITAIKLGVPGFTALRALQIALEQAKQSMRILILGSSGGVGSNALNFFCSFFSLVQGINISREINKSSEAGRAIFAMPESQLMPGRWDFIFDTLGGPILGAAIRFVKQDGVLVSSGNVLGNFSTVPLAPFYSRNVRILGLNLRSDAERHFTDILKIASRPEIQKIVSETPAEFLNFDAVAQHLSAKNSPSGTRKLIRVNEFLRGEANSNNAESHA